MSQRSDDLYRRILELRAERLGVSPEKADSAHEAKPLFLLAAEAAAKRLGTSAEKILAADLERMQESSYPTPECLTLDELEDLVEARSAPKPTTLSALSETRLAHLQGCHGCSTLVAASLPQQTHREEFLRRLDVELGRPAFENVSPARQPRTALTQRIKQMLSAYLPSSEDLRPPARAFITDAFAATTPVVVAVFLVVMLFHFAVPLSWTPETAGIAQTVARVALLPTLGVFVATIVLVAAAAWLASRLRVGSPVFRHSGGALAAGVVLAFVVGGYVWWTIREQAHETQVALRLMSARLAQVAGASIDVRSATGTFPMLDAGPGAVALTTTLHSPERAVYRGHTEGFKGTVVADVGLNGGAVYWEHGGTSHQVAMLEVGTIDSVTKDGIVLRGLQGRQVRLKAPPDPTRVPGERVVALVGPQGDTATGIYPIAALAPVIPTRSAYAKADETNSRLTRLWSNRNNRSQVEAYQVLFGFDKWDLDDGAQSTLASIVKEMKENPNLTVDLQGYADPVGSYPYNVGLSQRRVESVRRLLVEKGIELARINLIGLGPIMEKGTPNAEKRMVTVRLMVNKEDWTQSLPDK